MVENFKTIKYDSCEEIVEKKSRFIANLIYIENEQQAQDKIKEIKKKCYRETENFDNH